MKYLILVLLLAGCAKDLSDPRTIHGVDATFVPYVNSYLTEKEFYLHRGLDYDIPIQFGDLPDNQLGLCTKWTSGYRQIVIDAYYWKFQSEAQKESVIAHELGHCDLNLEHVDDPYAIMYREDRGSLNYRQLFGF